jgi:hypothetical protein
MPRKGVPETSPLRTSSSGLSRPKRAFRLAATSHLPFFYNAFRLVRQNNWYNLLQGKIRMLNTVGVVGLVCDNISPGMFCCRFQAVRNKLFLLLKYKIKLQCVLSIKQKNVGIFYF